MKFNVEVITPAVAAEYLKLNLENQRPVNKAQVAFYARMMKDGQWEANSQGVSFDTNGNLIDGQHRLLACVQANVPFETLVVRDCPIKSFKTIDTGYKRTLSNIAKIEGIPNYNYVSGGIAAYLRLSRQKNATSLFLTIKGGGNPNQSYNGVFKVSGQEVLDCYYQNPDWWQNLIKTTMRMVARCRILAPNEVMSITAYLVLQKGYDYDYVINFFEQLFFDELCEKDTIRQLRTKLVNDKLSKTKMTPQYKMQLIIKTWNYYKEGREVKVLRWLSSDPILPLE